MRSDKEMMELATASKDRLVARLAEIDPDVFLAEGLANAEIVLGFILDEMGEDRFNESINRITQGAKKLRKQMNESKLQEDKK